MSDEIPPTDDEQPPVEPPAPTIDTTAVSNWLGRYRAAAGALIALVNEQNDLRSEAGPLAGDYFTLFATHPELFSGRHEALSVEKLAAANAVAEAVLAALTPEALAALYRVK